MTKFETLEYIELLEIFSNDERLKRLIDLHTQKRLNDIICIEEEQGRAEIVVKEVAGLQTLRHLIFQEQDDFLRWKEAIIQSYNHKKEEEE